MSVSDRALAISKKKRHDDLCREISKSLAEVRSVGPKLLELHELGEFKQTHQTFEAFVHDLFDLERQQAYRLMDAARVIKNLSPIGDKIEVPKLESQLREVAKAPVEMQAEVVRKAAEKAAEQNRKPTAKDFKQVVSELLPATSTTTTPPNPKPAPAPTPAPPPSHHPKEMAGPLMAHVSSLTKMLNDIKKRAADRGGEWIDVQAISTQISAIKYSLKSSIYYADCPSCAGKGCPKCKQTGWLPELKSATVEGTK